MLLILAMVTITVMVCIIKRRRKRNPTIVIVGEDSWDHIRATCNRNNPTTVPKPLYDHIFAEQPSVESQTSSQNGTRQPKRRSAHSTTPREILAFNLDIPATFKPFPPPPLITVNREQSTSSTRLPSHDYDTPEVMHLGTPERALGGGYYDVLRRANMTDDEASMTHSMSSVQPYYDQVEVLHEDSGSVFTGSLRLSASQERESSKFSTWDPSVRPRASSKRDEDYDHTYCEPLEPSMLQNGRVLGTHEWGLPYAPIYDTPKPLGKSQYPHFVSPLNIVEIKDLGIGRFGKVSLAATTGLSLKDLKLGENDNKNRSLLVAIKKLSEDANESLREAFESEIKFMSRMKHANVVRLLGVCRSANISQQFLMIEYMEKGDLCGFLQKNVLVKDSVRSLKDNQVTPLILLYMAVQIASGMRYLASRKFVHRDLATRNCLVGRDFVVKISDFGMSCNLYESFYYRIQGRLILPIRWMAFETFYGKFSVRSDVWSYGIVLWEIFTLAKHEPYHQMTDEELIIDAMRGEERTLLSTPEVCPADVFDIMKRCWVHEPTMRADFEEIYSRLFMAYVQMSKQL